MTVALKEDSTGYKFVNHGVTSENVLEIGDATIQNLEFPVTAQVINVRYTTRFTPPVLDGDNESAAMYTRVDPVATHGLHPWAWYLEITDNQTDANAGGGVKILHAGHGDAFDAILLGATAVGYEAATYIDTSRGFIATLQYIGGSPAVAANSIHYAALWDSPEIPNFGQMLFQECPGHAITIQKYDGVNGGGPAAADGQAAMRITENDYANHRWTVFNDGRTRIQSLDASAGDTFNSSPFLELFGARWNGSANVSASCQLILNQISATAGDSELRINIGDSGSESLVAQFTGSGHANGLSLDMQDNTLLSVDGITMTASGGLNMNGGAITNMANITFGTGTIDLNGGDITNIDDMTCAGSGSVFDMQAGTIIQCGGLTMNTGVGNLDLQNGTISNSGNITMKAGGATLDLQGGPISNATSIDGSSYARMLGFAADGDPGAVASTAMITNVTGIGDGSASNLTALDQGTGSGPASFAVAAWLKVYDGATTRWVPMCS